MTTDPNRLRADFINTQVITRNTGKRLGVIKEVLVDIDQREVVALGIRDSILAVSGLPQYMYLNSMRQVGDVILVENDEVLEDIEADLYSPLINCQVITETGEPLGKVRDFQFNAEDGSLSSLIIDSLGISQIPDQLISTYEISVEEIVSSGPNRIIVFEGSEERVTQLTVGVLERLGIGRPPWEREEEMYYTPTTSADKQLGTGMPVQPPVARPLESRASVVEENWEEDDWEEARSMEPPPLRQQAETIRYPEYDEPEADNWEDVRQEPPRVPYAERSPEPSAPYQDLESDVWDDDAGAEAYDSPPVNLPKKVVEKTPEYEEEPG